MALSPGNLFSFLGVQSAGSRSSVSALAEAFGVFPRKEGGRVRLVSSRFPGVALLAGLGFAALYLAVVFAGRNHPFSSLRSSPVARVAPREQPPWLAPDPEALDIYQFYASTGSLIRGEAATICYGTFHAVKLALDPPVKSLSPARNRCFSVSPEQDTTYRLDAWDAAGNQTSKSFTIHVAPAPPRLLFLAISSQSIRRGEKPNFCYGATNATQVTLKPLGQSLPVRDKFCVVVAPALTTHYVLEAVGPGGRDQIPFTIKVR